MKKVMLLIGLLLGSSPVHSKEFKIPADPQATVRAKYHHREMGGVAVSEDSIAAITSRGWVIRVSPEGRLLWRIPAGCNPVTGPTIYNANLYYGCAQGVLISRKLEDGKENWRYQFQDSIASRPAFSSDLIVFQSGSGMIFFLNQADGSLKYIARQGGRTSLSMLGASQPMISEDRVYLGMLDGNVLELKLADAALGWKAQIFSRRIVSDVDYSLVADRDTLYAGALPGLCALSRNTGKIFWCVKDELEGDFSQDQQSLYALNKDWEILVIDKITGVVDKRIPLKKSFIQKWKQEKLLDAEIRDQKLILVTSLSVWQMDTQTQQVKKIMSFPEPTRSAKIQGDRLFILNAKGYLIAKDLK